MKMIRAELFGWDRAAALGVSVKGNAPICMLARRLIRAGINPDLPMVAYRGRILALRVRSLATAARLTVRDDNRGTPRFVPYRSPACERAPPACGVARSVRKSEEAAGTAPTTGSNPTYG